MTWDRGGRSRGVDLNRDPYFDGIELAACRGTTPELFFPGKGESVAAAKAVCRGCEVRQACLDYAVNNHENLGVWGGATARERRNIRAQRHQRGAA